mmetsp:Transcript_50731/g.152790  ORF Transcript_50731/g.152790 Transcript_50731/m.152790 type:complete len:129 (-) Transcript_50731:259-645(-)
MRNYMPMLIRSKGWNPNFPNPAEGNTIQEGYLARFLLFHIGRMLKGFPPIIHFWLKRENFDDILVLKESIPKELYLDMHRCIHFSKDSDNKNWDVYKDNHFTDPLRQKSSSGRKGVWRIITASGGWRL